MSVTFTIAGVGRPADCCCIPWDKFCTHCGRDTHGCECLDGPGCPCKPCQARSQLNVGNANARDLLQAMGYQDSELMGEARVRELIPRITHALRGTVIAESNKARPVSETGRVIDCGRREGYMEEKLRILLKLCHEAGPLGRITWA